MAQSELWKQLPTVDTTVTISLALAEIIREVSENAHVPPEVAMRLMLASGVNGSLDPDEDPYLYRRLHAAVAIERWLVSEITQMMEGDEVPF